MKKLMISLATILMTTGVVHAELPDFTKVWQDIRTGRTDKARIDLEDLYSQYRAANEGKQWKKAHSEESSKDVEEWLHFQLIRLYIAQLDGIDSEIKLEMSNIRNLTYLEFMGKPLVD